MAQQEIDDPAVTAVADRISAAIIKSLGASVIPSSIPGWAGHQIRETAKHGAFVWVYTVPTMAGTCFQFQVRLNPDGTMDLEMRDTNASPFWRGTFRPADDDAVMEKPDAT
jgi:hypothetical protein